MEKASSLERGPAPEEASLRDYVIVVLRKWWLVAAVFAVTVVTGGVFASRAPDVYEARTKLLIVGRVSERLAAPQSGELGAALSIDTLSALATANDLLQEMIVALELRDPVTGRPWGPEALAGMIEPTVETARAASLPLLTMKVRGGDPRLVKRIADKWAEVFVKRNAQLFATEAVRSYDFVSAQYQETQRTLRAKQDEKLAYQRANPLPPVQNQLEVTIARHRELVSSLQATRAVLAEAEIRQSYYQDIGRTLRSTREEKAAFERANPLESLQSELSAVASLHREFLSRLQLRQASLAEATARIESLSAALKAEPPLISTKRSIPNESLFTVLAGGISADRLRALGTLEITDEEANPTYLSLKETLHREHAAAAAYAAEVRDLESRTADMKRRTEQLTSRIAEVKVSLSSFDDEIAVFSVAFRGETLGPRLTQHDVTRLARMVADLETRTLRFEGEIHGLSDRNAQIQVDVSRLDQEASVLASNLNRLALIVQEARTAKEEQAGSIRIVEAAVEPQVPVGPNRRQSILLAGLVGIVLGVVGAFVVHYLQPRPPSSAAAPGARLEAPS